MTLEPDDMGDSPVENSVDDLESEMTEDGESLILSGLVVSTGLVS